MHFSIRQFLLFTLFLSVIGVGAVVSIAAYFQAQHEIEELFDAQLAQQGRLMSLWVPASADALDPLVLSEHIRGHKYERYVAVQYLTPKGDLLLTSHSLADELLLSPPFKAGLSIQDHRSTVWHVFAQPLPDGNWLAVGERQDVRDELARNTALALVLPYVIAIPGVLLCVVIALRRGLAPLVGLTRAVKQRDDRNMTPLHMGEEVLELQPLVQALNHMLERLDGAIQREQRFTMDAAHELRTLLTVLRLHADNARDLADEHERQESLRQLQAGIDRATRMVAQLLTLARLTPDSPGSMGQSALLPGLRQVLADLSLQADEREVALSLEADDTAILVPLGEEAVSMLFRNLVENALRYGPGHGVVQIRVSRQSGQVSVRVCDNGSGIPPELAERVCERFFRGNHAVQGGAGLGLSIVQRLVELAGGELRFWQAGTFAEPDLSCVEVILPLAS